MKLGVICDGISRDLAHALEVMGEFDLKHAELQFVWDKEIGDHDESEKRQIKEACESPRKVGLLPLKAPVRRAQPSRTGRATRFIAPTWTT